MAADMSVPHILVADLSTSGAKAGLALMTQRTEAVAGYLRSFAHVQQTGELLALQLDYWNRLVDDYASAFSQAVAPVLERAQPATDVVEESRAA